MKKSQNIFKNTSRCVECNGAIFFQIFVNSVYFAGIRSSTKKEKEKKLVGWTSNARKKY
jgi:hypothetical protein